MELAILLQSYNMTNVIEFPTRTNEGHGTAIDGISIDVSGANHFTIASISNGLSNHDAQYVVLERGFSYQAALPFHKIRVINKETINYFIETIKKETWGKIYSGAHTNDIFNVFLNTFFVHFESCFPIQYVTKKSRDNSWMTPGIRISCKKHIVSTYSAKQVIIQILSLLIYYTVKFYVKLLERQS
jgi:hypothetical protein